MSNERREQGHKSHAEKMARMLGKAEHHADEDVKVHERTKPHLKPAQIAAIADREIEMKGKPKKKRLDRAARKKGGRSGKGDVNIIIAVRNILRLPFIIFCDIHTNIYFQIDEKLNIFLFW